MHIPDGYLAPVFSLGMGAGAVPAWLLATRRVRAVLNNRTVPLLAMFSAFVFTVMMFNIPVPGGTTAHAVGGTIVAIVLGPWAAVIAVSTALIIQALFFGDGGVLAIFANCFNMGVALPFAGYLTYRLIAARSPLLSTRRVWAAAIGGYVGITVAAILVGLELGLQPILFVDPGGQPLYSPYGLAMTLPSMLISHLFGASIVEGIVSALVLAYIQRHHPEYLTGLARLVAGREVALGERPPRPFGQVAGLAAVAMVLVLLAAGLLTSGGDPARLFGADWSSVDWPSVATMLLVTGAIGVVVVPLVRLALPAPLKGVGTAYALAAVLAPLGLIAPGFAFGEGGADDLQQELGYVPEGLQRVSGLFSAPLADYNLPLPFFDAADAPMWHLAIGYELAGVVGILLLGAAAYGLGLALRGRETGGGAPPPRPAASA